MGFLEKMEIMLVKKDKIIIEVGGRIRIFNDHCTNIAQGFCGTKPINVAKEQENEDNNLW